MRLIIYWETIIIFVSSGEYRKLSDLFDHFMMFSTLLAISLSNSRYV